MLTYKDNRYFYSLLPPTEQRLYELLYDGILNRKTRFSFDLRGVDLARVRNALSYDCPELYAVRSFTFTYTQSELWFTSPSPYLYTPEEDRAIRKKLDEIADSFPEGQDDFSFELAVHAYITRTCRYDKDYAKRPRDSVADCENHSMVGPLLRGLAVCAGFAHAVQYLMLRRGIPVVYCVGTSTSAGSTGGHGWLIVKIRGCWYHLDISHDVCLTDGDKTPRYTYFNVTDREISANHTFDPKTYEKVRCIATSQNYYKKYGRYYFTATQMRDALEKILASAYPFEEERKIEFRIDEKLPQSAAEAVLRDVLSRTLRATKVAWSFGSLGTASAVFTLRTK